MATSTDTIVNLPYWYNWPMGASNYGGDLQVYTVEPYHAQSIGMALNSVAQAQIPPFYYSPVTTPQIDQNQVSALADSWSRAVNVQVNNNKLSIVTNMLSSTKQRLLSKLATEGLDDASKQKIEALLAKLDELERQLKEVVNSQNATEQFDKLHAIEVAARGILAEAAQVQVATNNTQTTDNTDNTDNTEQTTTENTDATQATQTQSTTGEATATEPQGAGGEKLDLNVMADDPAARTIAQNFRDAINYTNWLGITGTDDEKFDAACEAITPENVVAVMLAYNKFHSTEDGESFMEAFMYDADGSQKPKFGKHIANCLKEVTIALGIYDECDKDFTEIYDELGDASIDNTIYECYDRILERICKAAGGSKYATRTSGESKLPAAKKAEE